MSARVGFSDLCWFQLLVISSLHQVSMLKVRGVVVVAELHSIRA